MRSITCTRISAGGRCVGSAVATVGVRLPFKGWPRSFAGNAAAGDLLGPAGQRDPRNGVRPVFRSGSAVVAMAHRGGSGVAGAGRCGCAAGSQEMCDQAVRDRVPRRAGDGARSESVFDTGILRAGRAAGRSRRVRLDGDDPIPSIAEAPTLESSCTAGAQALFASAGPDAGPGPVCAQMAGLSCRVRSF